MSNEQAAPAATVEASTSSPAATQAPSTPVQGTQSQSQALPTLDSLIAQALSDKSPNQETPAQEGSVESAPTETVSSPKEAEPKKDVSASRFAALSRREKELRQKEADMDKRLAEVESKFKNMSTKEQELKSLDEKWSNVKKSPLKNLKDMGLSFNDLTQDALGQYKEPELDPVQQKLSYLEQQLAESHAEKKRLEETINKKFNDLDAKEAQIALKEVNDTIKETVSNDPDKYELIANIGPDAFILVKDVMSEYYMQHGKILDYSEACDIVEKYYVDYFNKFTETKKIKSRFEQRPAVVVPPSKQAAIKQEVKEVRETPLTTLRHTSASAAQANVDIDKLSKSEAINYLARQLKYHD